MKKLKRSGKRRSATRSLLLLKFLQKYCNELLSCDLRVSQSASLIQFFHPNAQDLEPEFSKNRQADRPAVDPTWPNIRPGGRGEKKKKRS